MEHYYYLFYLDKYHTQCLNILNDSEIIINVDYKISKKYMDNKMSYELYNKIFKKENLKNLKIINKCKVNKQKK